MSSFVQQQLDSTIQQALSAIDEISNVETSESSDPIEITRDNLVKSANALIKKIPDLISVLELQCNDLTEKEVRDSLLAERVDIYKGKLRHLRSKLKESQVLSYTHEIDIVHQQRLREYVEEQKPESATLSSNRDELFAGRTKKKDPPKSTEDQILAHNKNITSSLQSSKQLMTMSVMQTELNIDTLDQQSKDLTQLNNKLVDLESVLVKSRQIVKFIEKQDRSDKRRIYCAIGFLLLCSAWVIWRRVLKLPVKILFWSLLKAFGIVNWLASKSNDLSRPKDISPLEYTNTVAESWSLASSIEPKESAETDIPYIQDLDAESEILSWEDSADTVIASTEEFVKEVLEGLEQQQEHLDEQLEAEQKDQELNQEEFQQGDEVDHEHEEISEPDLAVEATLEEEADEQSTASDATEPTVESEVSDEPQDNIVPSEDASSITISSNSEEGLESVIPEPEPLDSISDSKPEAEREHEANLESEVDVKTETDSIPHSEPEADHIAEVEPEAESNPEPEDKISEQAEEVHDEPDSPEPESHPLDSETADAVNEETVASHNQNDELTDMHDEL